MSTMTKTKRGRRRSSRDELAAWQRELVDLGAWNPAAVPLAAAARRLEGVGATVALKCSCGRKLDVLRVRDLAGARLAGARLAAGSNERSAGAGGGAVWRARWVCPQRRCGAEHVARRDRLTAAFITALDEARPALRFGEYPLASRASPCPT